MDAKKTIEQPSSCIVCFEEFGKYRKPVFCPSCPKENPPSVCKECTEEYILGESQDAHCMQCKHAWGYQFMHDAFSNAFVTKTYRQNRQQMALEREKGLLQQTLPLVAIEKEKGEAKERMNLLKEEIRILKEEYYVKVRVIEAKMREEALIIRGGVEKTEGTKYLFPCPVKGDDEDENTSSGCRGFIEASSWRCGLCKVKVCKKCHVIKHEKKEGDVKHAKQRVKHACKKDDIATAKMVMEDTKPCPKCKARIFKITGCDQMFCTSCKTPFSWNTGKIVTGVVHNPHYYEMMRTLGQDPRNAPRNMLRNAGDAPCGGMPWFEDIYNHAKICNDETRESITTLHRRCSEIENYIARTRRRLEAGRGLEDIRLRWLLGEFKDEKSWQKSIFVRERNINKKREELAILDTFITGSIERFNDYVARCNEFKGHKKRVLIKKIEATEKLLEDIEQIKKFCNHAFVTNYKAMAYKQWPQIDFSNEYKGSGYQTELGLENSEDLEEEDE